MAGKAARPSSERPLRRLTASPQGDVPAEAVNRIGGAENWPERPYKRRKPRKQLSDWLLVRTRQHRERGAKRRIEALGWRCFLPDILTKGGRKTEIMFPGYVFAETKTKQWRVLTGMPGVIGPMMDGEAPAWVPIKVIRELRGMCDEDGTVIVPAERFHKGQAVKVKKGSFQDCVGVYIRRGTDRVHVLFRILGKELEIDFPTGDVTGKLEPDELASLDGKVRELSRG
jgi:transcription antitermination factor NusG